MKNDDYYLLRYVDLLIEMGQLEKAASICLEKEREDYADCEWAMKRCEILEKANDIKALKKLRKELAFELEIDDDDKYFANYEKMKDLFTPKEWKPIEERIAAILKASNAYSYSPNLRHERPQAGRQV
jgi:hypothetical protein